MASRADRIDTSSPGYVIQTPGGYSIPHKKDQKTGRERKKKKKHKERERDPRSPTNDSSRKLTHEAGDSSSTESQSSTTSKDSKREMLKFMIHEVREIRKQIDPSVTNLHRNPKDKSGDTRECDVDAVGPKKVYTKATHSKKFAMSSETEDGSRVIRKHYSRTDSVEMMQTETPVHRRRGHQSRQLPTTSVTDSASTSPTCERSEQQMLQTYPPLQTQRPAHMQNIRASPRARINPLSKTMPLSHTETIRPAHAQTIHANPRATVNPSSRKLPLSLVHRGVTPLSAEYPSFSHALAESLKK